MNLTNDKLEQVMIIAAKNKINIFAENALKPIPKASLEDGDEDGCYATVGFITGYGGSVTDIPHDSIPALVSSELTDILQVSAAENTAKIQALICDKIMEYNVGKAMPDMGPINQTISLSLQALCYIANNFHKYVPKDVYDKVTEGPIAFLVQFAVVKRKANAEEISASVLVDLCYKQQDPTGAKKYDSVNLPLSQIVSDMKQAE